jgi:hypothetical protein
MDGRIDTRSIFLQRLGQPCQSYNFTSHCRALLFLLDGLNRVVPKTLL